MKFNELVEIVLGHEGGYVNHPHDPGGETKFGISKRSYPHLDILNLTRDEAKAIYRKDYWEAAKVDQVPDTIKLIYFDCAVNQGIDTAIKCLQRAVGVKPDGVFGHATRSFMENTGSVELLTAFALERHEAYAKSPKWEYFGKGWSRRLLEILLLSRYTNRKWRFCQEDS